MRFIIGISYAKFKQRWFFKMAKTIKLTEDGLLKLKAELEDLKTNGRADIAEKIKVARGYGDLSENSEYDEAKNEQAKIEARIAEIEVMLKNVEIIEDFAGEADTVVIGVKVTALDIEFDEECEYRVVGSTEANPMEGKISDESPLGKALLGKKVDDEVIVDAPAGELRYKILKITKN
jgi:transcription elongation factor GreA